MIIYLATKFEFIDDVLNNAIAAKILKSFEGKLGKSVGASEISSWENSLRYMYQILVDSSIPKNAGVAIEYNIPQTAKRIDFILTGESAERTKTAIIVELKQWTEAKATSKDAIVKTFLGGRERETPHPSYQAWSYAALLEDFNEAVRNEPIELRPCAYLHNCTTGSTINSSFYQEHTSKAPAFLKDDALKLREFIKRHVKYGDSGDAIYRISEGKISPSKSLADRLLSLLQGNREFLMIDDQKLVYETALQLAGESTEENKNILIVDGGPGTGKSVVAINLLVELTNRKQVVQYVTKNAAPRAVYESKLTGSFTKSRITNLFKGSGSYTEAEPNSLDSLIVDEAHRLNEKSGMFAHLGENQIKEIINASKFSVFFIDENQQVTWKDIGEKAEIRKWAKALNANVHELALESQFRCNGSNGYLAWVDSVLQIRQTANPTLENVDYEFRVCSSPQELHDLIIQRNTADNKARLVAGYCWNWVSKKQPDRMDIEIPSDGFSAKWNLSDDGNLWILKPESVREIGCIHTCQGLEVDYIGVILGPDVIVRNGVIETKAEARAKTDKSIHGYKSLLKKYPEAARRKAKEIIKNTYRTLMTRGQKGCFVYSVDPETNQYLKDSANLPEMVVHLEKYPGLSLRVLDESEIQRFVNSVPIYDLQIAAGSFSEEQWVDHCDWVELPEPFVAKTGFFVTRVIGESMNKRIPNGSWCLFKADTGGSRQGKVVLVKHRDIQDPHNSGQYTVKIYHSEKAVSDDSWKHQRITLRPDSNTPGFRDIHLNDSEITELKVMGEFVAVLG